MSKRGGRYIALGSSSTYNTVTDYRNLYPYIIRNRIAAQYGAIEHRNMGWSGAKSTDMINGIHRISNLEANLFTLQIGANDATSTTPVISKETTRDNNRTIIRRLKQTNPDAVIVVVTPHTLANADEDKYAAYRPYIIEAAQLEGVAYCDTSTAWTKAAAATYLADALHANDAGHVKVADVLWPVVQATAATWLQKLG
ncbi:GDSL-like Lipase/Acylhydrolase family protein [Paenibacillus sp. UNCCL117]|uniref:SGNH/GDSL hydrolase family protein n=1 Tax=unclassified Paenibacillus TaxID=185978 RepID=UPI000884005A|nr:MULTISPECIES: SGNH/GDSL hydrolase family protein [unclassified Paenibacillus]SDD29374.1 GDSL-like Lipase/Acylhydrolase family protein [Paenibacillus sp. cl123]SFW40732.1 GDSL-like Lipase/Acylhydrolase family protein [Paenibacillus sp. UNCCL117]